MLRCILVDDEPSGTQNLEILLKDIENVVVLDAINDSKKALSKILELNPDIVFLDIYMPGLDGFELMEKLIENSFTNRIVFATSFDNFVLKALRMGAFDYLNKPVSRQEIKQMLERIQQIEQRTELKNQYDNFKKAQLIKLPIRNEHKYISTSEILYLKADGNYTIIQFSDQKTEISSYNLGWFEKNIESSNFIRISRACLINIQYLTRFEKNNKKCIISNNSVNYELDVSRRKLPLLKKHLEELA